MSYYAVPKLEQEDTSSYTIITAATAAHQRKYWPEKIFKKDTLRNKFQLNPEKILKPSKIFLKINFKRRIEKACHTAGSSTSCAKLYSQ